MSNLDWLVARPVAHRGLHDGQAGIIENMPSAFAAAVAANYGIEMDLRLSADGEAMVHHDETLERLTETSGRLAAMTAAQLKAVAFKGTADRMMTLGELTDLVAGRVTLLIELKSPLSGDFRLAGRVAEVLARYHGAAAVMSFDPAMMAALRAANPKLVRGIVAEKSHHNARSHLLLYDAWRLVRYFADAHRARPQFLAYSVSDLPAFWPTVARQVFRLPLLAWTVRTPFDRERARRFADQIIFEGFRA